MLRPNVLFELGVALGMGKRFIPILSQDVKRGRFLSMYDHAAT